MSTKILLIVLSLLFMTIQGKSQEKLTGPHGGRIKIDQGYKIETLGCENYLEIYLFNEVTEPIFNNGITGKVKFFYEGAKTTSEPIVKYGIDGFISPIKSADFFHYEVTLNILERITVFADFNECIKPKQ